MHICKTIKNNNLKRKKNLMGRLKLYAFTQENREYNYNHFRIYFFACLLIML